MAPVVVQNTGSDWATGYSNQRKIDRTSNGVLWEVHTSGFSIMALYSVDDGVTWVNDTGNIPVNSGGSGTIKANCSFFIDKDDYAHIVWKQAGTFGSWTAGYIYYRRGTPNADRTAYTWSPSVVIYNGDTNGDYPDIIAHREGTGWAVHIVFSYALGSVNSTTWVKIAIDNLQNIGAPSSMQIGGNYGTGIHTWPSIDFNHTGDGKTVAGGTPHLYAAWSAGAAGSGKGIRFRKATYSGGTWTWGTEREIDSTRYMPSVAAWLDCIFTGSKLWLAGGLLAPGNSMVLYERDLADTTTTTHVLINPVSGDTQLVEGSATYDANGNIYFIGRSSVSSDWKISYYVWNNGLSEMKHLYDAIGNNPYVSAKRGYSGNKIELVFIEGASSPYSVMYDSILLAGSGASGFGPIPLG